MAMFYGDTFMVDTRCVVAAGCFDGSAALDGMYLLALVLAIGEKGEMLNFGAIYPTKAAREADFRRLSAQKRSEDAAWELAEEED